MYKVEAILDKRIDEANKEFYFIKWRGYDSTDSTWEPYEHLKDNCRDIVQAFNSKNKHLKLTNIGLVNISSHYQGLALQPQKGKVQKMQSKKEQSKQKSKIQFPTKIKRINKKRIIQKSILPLRSKAKIDKNQKSRKVLRYIPDSEDSQNISNKISEEEKRSLPSNKDFSGLKKKIKQIKSHKIISGFQGSEPQSPQIKRRISERMSNQHEQKGKKEESEEDIERQDEKIKLERTIKIMGMKKDSSSWNFYVERSLQKSWVSHNFLLENFPRQLCLFYEKNLVIEQEPV